MIERTPCPSPKPYRITQCVSRDNGRNTLRTWRPPCDLLTCGPCKRSRMEAVAQRLLRAVAGTRRLYVARLPEDRLRTVERAFKRRAEGDERAGRLLVSLMSEHYQVSNIDCFTQQRVAAGAEPIRSARKSTAAAVRALLDPDLPVTQSARWSGAWRHVEEEETGTERFKIPFGSNLERDRFCHSYGIPVSLLLGGHELDDDDPQLHLLEGAVEWWRINERGLGPRIVAGRVISPIAPPEFVFHEVPKPRKGADVSVA